MQLTCSNKSTEKKLVQKFNNNEEKTMQLNVYGDPIKITYHRESDLFHPQ